MNITIATIENEKIKGAKCSRIFMPLFDYVVSSLIFVSLFLGLLQLFGAVEFWYALFAFLPLGLLYYNKKTALIIAAATLILFAVLFMVFNDYALNGAKLLLNGLFSRSESTQNYKYAYYTVNVVKSVQNASKMFTVFLFGLPISALSFLTRTEKNGFLVAAIALLAVIIQVYFGVLFDIICGLAFALAVLMRLTLSQFKLKFKSALIVFAVLLVVFFTASVAATAFYRGNAQLYNWSEDFRDLFYESESLSSGENGGAVVVEQSKPQKNEQTAGTTESGVPYTVYILLGFAFITAALVATKLVLVVVKKRKRKALLYASDNLLAINAAFTQAFQKLILLGLKLSGGGLGSYKNEIEKLFSAEYAGVYESASIFWQEANFSDEKPSAKMRESVLDFYRQTSLLFASKAKLKSKLKLFFEVGVSAQ